MQAVKYVKIEFVLQKLGVKFKSRMKISKCTQKMHKVLNQTSQIFKNKPNIKRPELDKNNSRFS